LVYSKVNNVERKYCAACEVISHSVIQCPLMHLNLDREGIIKKLKFPHESNRDSSFNRISSRI